MLDRACILKTLHTNFVLPNNINIFWFVVFIFIILLTMPKRKTVQKSHNLAPRAKPRDLKRVATASSVLVWLIYLPYPT